MGKLNTKVKKIRSAIFEVKREFGRRLADPDRYKEDKGTILANHVEFDKIALDSLNDAENVLLNFLGAVDE